LCMDSISAMAYINKYGGARSSALINLAMSIWTYCFRHSICLSTLYAPSAYSPVDAPSRHSTNR
jgi:hypothetical protein